MIPNLMKILLILASLIENGSPSKLQPRTSDSLNIDFSSHMEIVGNRKSIMVNTMHVSCKSDRFTEDNEYIGIVLYEYMGNHAWTLNGRRIRSGYIYLVKSEKLLNKYPQISRMHEKAYYDLFNQEIPTGGNIVASGFAYRYNHTIRYNQWKQSSGTFNAVRTHYTCTKDRDGVTEFDVIKDAIINWNNGNGQNFDIIGRNYHSICSNNNDALP